VGCALREDKRKGNPREKEKGKKRKKKGKKAHLPSLIYWQRRGGLRKERGKEKGKGKKVPASLLFHLVRRRGGGRSGGKEEGVAISLLPKQKKAEKGEKKRNFTLAQTRREVRGVRKGKGEGGGEKKRSPFVHFP